MNTCIIHDKNAQWAGKGTAHWHLDNKGQLRERETYGEEQQTIENSRYSRNSAQVIEPSTTVLDIIPSSKDLQPKSAVHE